MIHGEFVAGRSVKVRDVDVFVRLQDIHEYYGTSSNDDLPNGLPKLNIFRLYHPELAESLRREMDNRCLWDADHHLRQS